jgi:hypothetical protein
MSTGAGNADRGAVDICSILFGNAASEDERASQNTDAVPELSGYSTEMSDATDMQISQASGLGRREHLIASLLVNGLRATPVAPNAVMLADSIVKALNESTASPILSVTDRIATLIVKYLKALPSRVASRPGSIEMVANSIVDITLQHVLMMLGDDPDWDNMPMRLDDVEFRDAIDVWVQRYLSHGNVALEAGAPTQALEETDIGNPDPTFISFTRDELIEYVSNGYVAPDSYWERVHHDRNQNNDHGAEE